jgi:hypothetical protein
MYAMTLLCSIAMQHNLELKTLGSLPLDVPSPNLPTLPHPASQVGTLGKDVMNQGNVKNIFISNLWKKNENSDFIF